jgi:PAS domain S-box-containing protein
VTDDGRSDWEALFWAVFASSRNAMAIADADRLVVSANAAFEHLVGRPEEALVGRPIDDALSTTGQESIGRRWQATLARGETHGVEEITAADGRRRPLSYAAHVAHIDGRLVVLVVLMETTSDEGEVPNPGGMAAGVTPREREVIALLARGATSREIADELYISPETVRTHVRNAMEKTGTRTRAHLVAAAICRGLLPAISSR